MPDSDQPRRRNTEAVFRSGGRPAGNGHQPHPDHPDPTPDWAGVEKRLEISKQLIDLEVEADKPKRQRMARLERTVRLRLEVLLTLAFVGLEIAMFIVSPALFAFTLSVAGATALGLLRRGERKAKELEDEGDP